MKRLILIGFTLLVFVSCAQIKRDIRSLESNLIAQEQMILILSEQVAQYDFESLRVSLNQIQLQNQRFERELQQQAAMVSPPLPEPPPPPRTASDNVLHNIYEEGMANYHRRDFAAAIRAFTNITNQAPNHELAANAHYWTGESFYALGDFSAARLSFQRVVDQYPSSNKFIDSQVKIAMTWMRQQRPEQARVILEAIRRDYPNYERMSLVEQNLRLIR